MSASKELVEALSAMEKHLRLKEFDLDWTDGERTLHEMWRLYPPRRFNSYAITSLYLFASEFCPPNARILEVGCATGFGTNLLASKTRAAHVLGIDLEKNAVKWGHTRYARPNLETRCINLLDNKLDDQLGTFDMVYCSNVMEHIPDFKPVLLRMHQMLKPGGLYFHVTPPSGKSGGNKYHVTNFRIPQWQKFLTEAGFHNQRFFSQLPNIDREKVSNEYDFIFEECGPDDMLPSSGLGSISGIILARKSINSSTSFFASQLSDTSGE